LKRENKFNDLDADGINENTKMKNVFSI